MILCSAELGHPCDSDDGDPCPACAKEAAYWRRQYGALSPEQRRRDRMTTQEVDDELDAELRDAGRSHLCRR